MDFVCGKVLEKERYCRPLVVSAQKKFIIRLPKAPREHFHLIFGRDEAATFQSIRVPYANLQIGMPDVIPTV